MWKKIKHFGSRTEIKKNMMDLEIPELIGYKDQLFDILVL